MKRILYILIGAAMIAALSSCEPKFEYTKVPYVIFNESSISAPENLAELNATHDSLLTVLVTAYPVEGKPHTEVMFQINDGEGDSGAKMGTDFTVVSPANGVLFFDGDATAAITIRLSEDNVGIYTGRKKFSIELTEATNGYTIGGAYATTIYITDSDRNLDGESVYGVYSATGSVLATNTTATDETWQLKIYEYPDDEELVYVDGLVPTFTGGYDTYGDFRYAAYGWLEDNGNTLVIPSQILETEYTYSGTTYLYGYTPCVEFSSDDGWLYSGTFPDLKFYYNSASDSWISNYGVFLAGFTSMELSSMAVLFDAVAPTFTLVKLADLD